MKTLLLVNVLLAILPILVSQKCSETSRTPFIKATHKWVGREATCHYKCVLKHKKQIKTDYWVVDTCTVDYKPSSQSVCCEGFKSSTKGDCEPICQGCLNGRCTGPNVCTCSEGFRNRMGTCVPVCDPECGHGTCVAPGQCACHDGYGMDLKRGCIPACDPPCQNGACLAGNTCKCFYGFERSSKVNVCIPECDAKFADCGNGTCSAPNSCSCEEGFVFENGRCTAKCDPACINGECTKPNACTCKGGFSPDAANANICVPICDGGCRNGTCIAPNTCQCLPGYHQSHTERNKCEPSCDQQFVDSSNGQCIAPNVLQCNDGFLLEHSSLSGRTHCRYPCNPECVNGFCLPDGSCKCWFGFTRLTEEVNVCQPINSLMK